MGFDVLAELEAHGTKRYTPEDAYAWCRTFTKARASNFYYAFSILPRRKRNAIYAAYAFSGYVDDIADELTERSRQEEEIARARERLDACYEGVRQGPLFIALGDAVDRFGTPREHFEELVTGVEMDFTIDRYETWADLQQYCRRVASMVGHICVSIFGAKPHPRAAEFAASMGLGLQIVNIMRDVKEDAGRGRVYFPTDELEAHGLTPDDILACRYDHRFVSLMAAQGQRAHHYFGLGRGLLPLLDVRSRMCVNVLQGVYFELLRRIEARGYDVLNERVGLSGLEKLAAIARLWAGAAMLGPARSR